MKGSLLADSANSASPILIDDFVLTPNLLLLCLVLLRYLYFGSGA